MKKILLSLGMIVFVGGLIVGATGAFFSDTETSTGNTFAAGAIDLQIDNSSYGFDWNRPGENDPQGIWGSNPNNSWELSDLDGELFFSFVDLKPGDYGEDTISLHVDDNDAYACMAFDLTGTPENGQNEPEAEVDPTAGDDEGELQNYLSFLFWHDDGDNILEVGEAIIDELSGPPGSVFTGEWLALAQGGDTPLPGDTTQYIGKGWCFGDITADPEAQDGGGDGAPTADTTGFICSGAEGDHNDAQTDGIVVDVGFYAVQSRNNDNFQCSDLPPFDGGETPVERESVGAVLGAYSAPSCDVTASSTLQASVDQATSGQTVCVPDGTYTETVVINKPLTLAAENGPLNSATITGGVQIDSSDVTVTGFIINPGDVPADPGNIGVFLNGSLSNIEISYNDIDGTGVGDDRGVLTTLGSTYSNVVIDNNLIRNLITGVYLNPHTGNIDITNNDIDDNVAGVGGFTSATVTHNEFDGNTDEAIGADSSYDGTSIASFNNFLTATDRVIKYGVWPAVDATPPDVLAENNFWATGGAAQTGGAVDFTPEEGSAFPHNN